MIPIHLVALLCGLAIVAAVLTGRLSTVVTDPVTGEARGSNLAPALALVAGLCVAVSAVAGLA